MLRSTICDIDYFSLLFEQKLNIGFFILFPGQGPSKKVAKHQAAEAALNILQIDAEAV